MRGDQIPNPYYPFVNLRVGDVDLTMSPPSHVMSFRYKRNTASQANTFSFDLFDDEAIQLEETIAQGYQDVHFMYGYSGGARSNTYKGIIDNYSIQLLPGGHAILSVTGYSTAVESHFNPITKTYEGLCISDIVTDIANEQGWILGKIEPTEIVWDGDTDKTFICSNKSPVAFIKEQLIPYAKSTNKGLSGYQLWFDDESDGLVVNFAPVDYSKEPESSYIYQWNASNIDTVRSFSPQFPGAALLSQGGGKTQVNYIDSTTGKPASFIYGDSTDTNKPITGSYGPDYDRVRSIINASILTPQEAELLASDMWTRTANFVYNASLEIMGDPTIMPMSTTFVGIITKQGLMHHSSGIYLILEIEDSIQNGDFSSTLSLVRNASNYGLPKIGSDVNG